MKINSYFKGIILAVIGPLLWGISGTVTQFFPVLITCYLALKIKKVPSSKQIISIILAMTGTFLIITEGNIRSLSISNQALFWGLCSAITSTIYTLQPIELIKKYDSISVVGWGMLLGGLLFSFIGRPWQCSGSWSLSSLLAVFFVVIFGTLIAFYCYIESLKYINPSTASILGSGEPLSAAFLSVIFLNTPLSFFQWFGTACIIITIILLSKTSW